eukprot:1149349-Pelagomonas_calceolata.AAC.5
MCVLCEAAVFSAEAMSQANFHPCIQTPLGSVKSACGKPKGASWPYDQRVVALKQSCSLMQQKLCPGQAPPALGCESCCHAP